MKANKMVSLDIARRSTRYLMQFESICSIVIFFHTDLINQELYVTIIYYVKAQKLLKKLPFTKKKNVIIIHVSHGCTPTVHASVR